ncbi:MAG: threonine synthase [Armatimonadota bacterium]
MPVNIDLVCVKCGREYTPKEVKYTCIKCGNDGLLDIFYDYNQIKKKIKKINLKKNPDRSIARYDFILPVKSKDLLPQIKVGGTPIIKSTRLNNFFNLKNLYIKDDTRNPTASFKDRASAVAVAKAREFGYKTLTCASTGNAASSMAGMCAAQGLKAKIFVPKTAPEAKVAQLLIYGAEVFMVKGTYDEAFDFCLEVSKKYPWYNRNTGYNPYLLEGKKTCAMEICEQFDFNVPDKVIVSVGDGCIIGGIYKGFYDFYKLGWIDKIPQIIGVQAEGSSPLVKAFNGNRDVIPEKAETLADSICVGHPRAAGQALKGVRNSKGFMVSVKDKEILDAIKILARQSGIFAEPAGAASIAGLKKLVKEKKIKQNEKVVVIITGHGLKDIKTALSTVNAKPHIINPSMKELQKALKGKS